MKVLLVGGDTKPCGANLSMKKLIEEEDKLGINVIPVVRSGDIDELLGDREHYVVNAYPWIMSDSLPKLKFLLYKIIKSLINGFYSFRYARIIKKENPDIVHVNSLPTYAVVSAALKLKKPVIWHIREFVEEDLNCSFWNKHKAYNLMQKVTKFIAVSDCVLQKYQPIVSDEKIIRIYNGIDEVDFYNREHEILKKDKIVISFAGRITEEKGQYQCLLNLIPFLKEHNNVVLRFAGEGSSFEINKLRHLIIENEIEDKVVLLGKVSNMPIFWGETDIAIVYSKYEAFGRVTIEAKMAGALVVGYAKGGTTELINNGYDGYLFDENKTQLNDVIESIINNKELSQEIAKTGRETAIKNFSSRNNAEQIYNLYKSILKISD